MAALCACKELMEHFELLNKYINEWEEAGITLYEHSFNNQAFGSWYIVAGKPHHRLRFSWDGKESYLGIGESEFANSSSAASWSPITPGVGSSQLKATEIFQFISTELSKRYGT
ncbi:hypothetical protein [Aurantivibrio infirmus]